MVIRMDDETLYLMNPWWEGNLPDTGIPRPRYLALLRQAEKRRQIEIVLGGRRIGKTTLVKQYIAACLERGLDAKDLLYMAMDHPRAAGISASEILRDFRALFGHRRDRKVWLFLDEVQESPGWEAELKALYDNENLKLVCTGSTSALLAAQGGKLTGRQLILTVYPLGFDEYLVFRGEEISRAEEYRYVVMAEEYLQTGGYPENVLQPSETYLAQLLDDVISRDLIRLQHIRRPEVVRDLMLLLASSVGSRISYNRLSKSLGISLDTAKDYLSYLKSAYLVETINKWTTSHNERVYAQKKAYLLDTGMKTVLTGQGDLGAKAENAIFMDFVRRDMRPGYYAEGEGEVDFVTGEPGRPTVVESKYHDSFEWEDRRLRGARLFLRRFPGCRNLTVVTRDAAGKLKKGGTEIVAVPLWKYLLRHED